MAGFANFYADARGEFGGKAEARTKNFQDERIAGTHQFHTPAHTNAQCFEALCVLIAGLDVAYHGANARGEFIEPHICGWLAGGIHNAGKIICPTRKSITSPAWFHERSSLAAMACSR